MVKIIIVRHGQSIANAHNRFQGECNEWNDTSLSEKGIEQARILAKRFEDENVDKIYSSTLKRSSETAWEIARSHDISVIEDERLVDSYGEEDIEEGIRRCKDFLENIPLEENIIIVAHGQINLILISLLLKMGEAETMKFVANSLQRNTCVNVLEKEGGEFALKILNDVSHAEGKLDTRGRW